MTHPDTSPLDVVLDGLVERIADRTVEKVVERLHAEGWGPVQPAEEQLLDVEAAAAKLAVKAGAIYKLTEGGKLPAVRVGGRLRVRQADINQFILNNRRSEERACELARAAQASASGPPRTNARRSRPVAPTSPRRRGAEPDVTNTTTLKVLTNNTAADAPTARRSK